MAGGRRARGLLPAGLACALTCGPACPQRKRTTSGPCTRSCPPALRCRPRATSMCTAASSAMSSWAPSQVRPPSAVAGLAPGARSPSDPAAPVGRARWGKAAARRGPERAPRGHLSRVRFSGRFGQEEVTQHGGRLLTHLPHCSPDRRPLLGGGAPPGLPSVLLTAGKHSDGSQSSEMCISPAFVTGGTDIISCFMGQNPTLPVYKGEIQARNLGMAVEVWNEQGTASLAAATPGPRRGSAWAWAFAGRWLSGSLCLSGEQTAVPRASFDSAQAPRPQPPSACLPEVWEFGELGAQGRQAVGRHPSFWALGLPLRRPHRLASPTP